MTTRSPRQGSGTWDTVQKVPMESSRGSHGSGKGKGQHRADTELVPGAAVERQAAAKELGEHRRGGAALGTPTVQNPASPESMDQVPPQRGLGHPGL